MRIIFPVKSIMYIKALRLDLLVRPPDLPKSLAVPAK